MVQRLRFVLIAVACTLGLAALTSYSQPRSTPQNPSRNSASQLSLKCPPGTPGCGQLIGVGQSDNTHDPDWAKHLNSLKDMKIAVSSVSENRIVYNTNARMAPALRAYEVQWTQQGEPRLVPTHQIEFTSNMKPNQGGELEFAMKPGSNVTGPTSFVVAFTATGRDSKPVRTAATLNLIK